MPLDPSLLGGGQPAPKQDAIGGLDPRLLSTYTPPQDDPIENKAMDGAAMLSEHDFTVPLSAENDRAFSFPHSEIYSDNYFDGVKKLSEAGRRFTPIRGEAQKALEGAAQLQAYDYAAQMGLVREDGSIAKGDMGLVNRLMGALLTNSVSLHSQVTPEEMGGMFENGFGKILDHGIGMLNAELTAAHAGEIAEGSSTMTKLQGGEGGMTRHLAERLSTLKQLRARMGEPKVQRMFMGHMKSMMRQNLDRTGDMTEEQLQATVLDNMLGMDIDKYWPAQEGVDYQDSPWAGDVRAALEKTIFDRSDPYSHEKLMAKAFEGATTSYRLRAMGVPDELAGQLSPLELAFMTHPKLKKELGETLEANRAREMLDDQDIAYDEELVDAYAELFGSGDYPAVEPVLDILSKSFPSPEEEFVQGIDIGTTGGYGHRARSAMAILGDKMMVGLRAGKGMMDHIERGASLIPGLSHAGEMQMKAWGLMTQAAGLGEEAAEIARGDGEVYHGGEDLEHDNPYFGNMDGYIKVAKSGNLYMSPEMKERIVNPEGSMCRTIATHLWGNLDGQVVEAHNGLNVGKEFLQIQYEKTRAKLADEGLDQTFLTGSTELDVEEADLAFRAAHKEYAEGRADLGDLLAADFAKGATAIGGAWRETLKMAMLNPDDLLLIEGLSIGAAEGFRAVAAQVRASVPAKRMIQAARIDRARRVVGEALIHDAEAVKNLRDFVNKTLPNTPGGQDAAIRAVTDDLDALVKRNTFTYDQKLGKYVDLGDAESARLRRDLIASSRVVDMVDPSSLDDLMSSMKVDQSIMEWTKRPKLLEAMMERSGRLGKSNQRFLNKYLTRNLRKNTREIMAKIADNPAVTMEEMMVSPLQFGTKRELSWLSKMRPSMKWKYKATATKTALLEWFNDHRTMALQIRKEHSYARLNNIDWAQRTIASQSNEIRMSRVAQKFVSGDAFDAIEARVTLAKEKIRAAAEYTNTMTQMGFDKKLKIDFDNHPLFKDTHLHEVMNMLADKHGDLTLYQRVAKPFETPDEFYKRVRAANEYLTMGAGKNGDWAEWAKGKVKADKIKKKVLKEFMTNDGLSRADFDADGRWISPGQTKRTAKQYRALAANRDRMERLTQNLDPNDATELMFARSEDIWLRERMLQADKSIHDLSFDEQQMMVGMTRNISKSKAWKDIETMAKVERAAGIRPSRVGFMGIRKWVIGAMQEDTADMFDGNGAAIMNSAKDMGLQARINIGTARHRHEAVLKSYNRLTDNDRRYLDAAWVIARDEGIGGPLNKLRLDPRFTRYFNDLDPVDDEAALRHVYDESETFRQDLLLDRLDAGTIDMATYLDIAGPYGARTYRVFQEKRLKGLTPRDQEGMVSAARSDEAFLERRHHKYYRARIVQEGSRAIEETFDTALEAERWVESRFGKQATGEKIRSSSGQGTVGMQYKTGLKGQKARILDPIGDKLLKELEPEDASRSFMQRLGDMLVDNERMRYVNAMARPGVVISAKKYAADKVADQAAGKKGYKEFTPYPLPKDRGQYGDMAGMHVHKKVAAQIDTWTHGAVFAKAMKAAAQELVDGVSMLDRAKRFFVGMGTLYKQAITTNQVAMNSACCTMNVISDALFGARAAAGKGFNTSIKGWKDRIQMGVTLMRLKWGKMTMDQLDPEMKHAINRGIIDEQTLAGIDRSSRESIRATWGNEVDPQGVKGHMRYMAKQIAAPLSDKPTRALLHKVAELDAALEKLKPSSPEFARLAARKENLQEKLGQSGGTWGKLWARAVNTKNVLLSRPSGVFGVKGNQIPDLYNVLQNAQRMGAYKYMVDKGMDWDEALDRVEHMMQDYSRVPDGVQKLSTVPGFSPIISFPYEAIRNTLNIAKLEPGFLAGFMGAVPALNAVSMGASGVDPNRMMSEVSMRSNSVLDVYKNLATKLYIGDGGGGVSVFSMPQANIPLTVLGGGPGMITGRADFFSEHAEEYTSLGVAGKIAANWLLGGPALNSGMALATQSDVFGRPYQSLGDSLLGEGGKLARLFIPPQTPMLGNVAARQMDTIESAPYLYSGRDKDVMSTLIRGTIGINAERGWPVPKSLRSAAAKITWMAAATMDPVAAAQGRIPTDDDKLVGKYGSLNNLDILQFLLTESSALNRTNTINQPYNPPPEEYDFRRAAAMKNSSAPGTRERGEELEREAIANFRRRLSKRTMHSDTTDEALALIRRESSKLDALGTIANLPTVQRAYVISRAVELGIDKKFLGELHRMMIVSKSGIRKPRSVGDVRDSIKFLDRALARTADPEKIQVLGYWRNFMAGWGMQQAKWAERKSQVFDPERANAIHELDRIERE